MLHSGCSHQPKPPAVESAKGAFDELRVAVRKKISEPSRAQEVVGLVDQLEQAMVDASKARKVHESRLRSLNANYDATEQDFKDVFREFNSEKSRRLEHILTIDQRARTLTTEREWTALSKDVARALESAAKAEMGM